jgi:hypothetical protein
MHPPQRPRGSSQSSRRLTCCYWRAQDLLASTRSDLDDHSEQRQEEETATDDSTADNKPDSYLAEKSTNVADKAADVVEEA